MCLRTVIQDGGDKPISAPAAPAIIREREGGRIVVPVRRVAAAAAAAAAVGVSFGRRLKAGVSFPAAAASSALSVLGEEGRKEGSALFPAELSSGGEGGNAHFFLLYHDTTRGRRGERAARL